MVCLLNAKQGLFSGDVKQKQKTVKRLKSQNLKFFPIAYSFLFINFLSG